MTTFGVRTCPIQLGLILSAGLLLGACGGSSSGGQAALPTASGVTSGTATSSVPTPSSSSTGLVEVYTWSEDDTSLRGMQTIAFDGGDRIEVKSSDGSETLITKTRMTVCSSPTSCEYFPLNTVNGLTLADDVTDNYIHPLRKDSFVGSQTRNLKPAPPQTIAGVPSKCVEGVSVLDSKTTTICTAISNGFLTLATDGAKTSYRLISIHHQPPDTLFVMPPGVTPAPGS